jgi:trans-aconitate methyltransferase
LDARASQESWDRQQEAYLPDREHRIAAMLDAVDAVADGDALLILDLAAGSGSMSLRTLARFPRAEVTLVDLDPVLLTIAEASLADRAAVVTADLNTTDWTAALPHPDFDAVLTATALHWLDAQRLTALYAEIHALLRPRGLFVNADHMPDEAMPTLNTRLTARARSLRGDSQSTLS